MPERDFTNEKSCVDRSGMGGPQTPEGKANSSQNARKHGGRSRRLVVEDETQEEFEKVERDWREQFNPEDYQEEKLVKTLVLNDWLHQRAERRLVEVEGQLTEEFGTSFAAWPPEKLHQLELMERYKGTRERAFYRAWSALRGLRRDIMNENEKLHRQRCELAKLKQENTELADEKTELKRQLEEVKEKLDPKPAADPNSKSGKRAAAAAEAEGSKSRAAVVFQGQRSKKKQKKAVTLEQWVEIEVDEAGETVTTQYPSNDDLIRRGQKLWPTPTLVVRRLNFVGRGPAAEYEWALEGFEGDRDWMMRYGGCGLQRMAVDDWLEHIEVEAAHGSGHLLPIGNLPRPQGRGGCECPVCTNNQAILDGDEDGGVAAAA